jgi:hypothetical protein
MLVHSRNKSSDANDETSDEVTEADLTAVLNVLVGAKIRVK